MTQFERISDNNTTTRPTSSSSEYYYQHGTGRVLSEIDKLAICSAYKANLGHDLRSPMAARFGRIFVSNLIPGVFRGVL